MDSIERDARIAQLAREIWEAEGRPDGQELRHWGMAERLVEAEIATRQLQRAADAAPRGTVREGAAQLDEEGTHGAA